MPKAVISSPCEIDFDVAEMLDAPVHGVTKPFSPSKGWCPHFTQWDWEQVPCCFIEGTILIGTVAGVRWGGGCSSDSQYID